MVCWEHDGYYIFLFFVAVVVGIIFIFMCREIFSWVFKISTNREKLTQINMKLDNLLLLLK